MRKIIFIISLVLIFLLSVYIIWLFLNNNVKDEISEYIPEQEITDEQFRKTIVALYFKDKTTNKMVIDNRIIDVKDLMKNPYYTLVNMLIGDNINENLVSVIPEGTVLNKAELKNDTVILDFSPEFINNHKGSLELERETIYAILDTLLQLKEVSKIKILINGEENKSFLDNKLNFSEEFLR